MSNKQECIHHWILESPNGRLAKGICRNCKEERQFSNLMPWEEEGRGSHWTTKRKKLAVDKTKAKVNQ